MDMAGGAAVNGTSTATGCGCLLGFGLFGNIAVQEQILMDFQMVAVLGLIYGCFPLGCFRIHGGTHNQDNDGSHNQTNRHRNDQIIQRAFGGNAGIEGMLELVECLVIVTISKMGNDALFQIDKVGIVDQVDCRAAGADMPLPLAHGNQKQYTVFTVAAEVIEIIRILLGGFALKRIHGDHNNIQIIILFIIRELLFQRSDVTGAEKSGVVNNPGGSSDHRQNQAAEEKQKEEQGK